MSSMEPEKLLQEARSLISDAASRKSVQLAASRLWMAITIYQGKGMSVATMIRALEFQAPLPPQDTCIINLQSGLVRIHPQFFIDYILHIEDLIWLLLHERGHILIDRLFVKHSSIPGFQYDLKRNWVDDCYINQNIWSLIKSDLPSRFYNRREHLPLAYDEERFKLFLEDLELSPETRKDAITLRCRAKDQMAIWTNFEKCYRTVYDAVLEWIQKQENNPSKRKKKQGEDNKNWNDLCVSGNISNENQKVNNEKGENNEDRGDGGEDLTGCGDGGEHRDITTHINYNVDEEKLKRLLNARKIDQKLTSSNITQGHDDGSSLDNVSSNPLRVKLLVSSISKVMKATSVTPPSQFTNKDLMLLSAGHIPPHWDITLHQPEKSWACFVDVSGSVRRYWPTILAIANSLRRYVTAIYQFSTYVFDATRDRSDTVHTSGGTSFEVVAAEILQRRFEHVIIVTDNDASLSKQSIQALKRQLKTCIAISAGKWKTSYVSGWEQVATEDVMFNVTDGMR